MPKQIQFLGVSFAVAENKVCAIASSDGDALSDLDGLTSQDVMAFLWTLKARASADFKTVLVGFDFAVDLEILFRDLKAKQKDIFYGINKGESDIPANYRRQRVDRQVEQDLQDAGNPLAEVEEVETKIDHAGFQLSCLPGKILRLARPKKTGLLVYDICSYFEGCDLSEARRKYLKLTDELSRIDRDVLPLWKDGLINEIVDRTIKEAGTVAALAEKVQSTVSGLDLSPRAWYGPSAIASHCLNKWEARKQAKRLKENNSPHELIKAVDVAYIGGRVELVTAGTIADVRTFDLNTAYGYATTLLSQFYTPLRFTRQYQPDCPFSCWLVDFELPDDVNIGILPMRASRGGISFPARGKGYFWQPEVDYLRQRYPGSFSIQWGYVGPDYKPVTFASEIQKMYDYRMILKEQGDAGEKIIKLALSNLYGKFAQNKGTAFYQCRAWAGWITSLVRRLMLEAITGIEDRVICFCQDAVHLRGVDAQVTVGTGLGQWKRQAFAEGFYVAPGIYDLREKAQSVKQASRGANLQLDFAKLAADLSKQEWTELSRSFFVGWQMARQSPGKYQDNYLNEVVESLSIIPAKLRARNYKSGFDWNTESKDSTISRRFSGQLSAPYRPNEGQSSLRLKLKDRGWA